MRIGGGIGSNEGDTPIYVANIHPHGCIGKSKQLKVSSVFGNISKGSPEFCYLSCDTLWAVTYVQ